MPSVLIFLKRKPGLSQAEFRAYYEDHHVPLCMRYMAGPRRYVRHYVESGPEDADRPFDVITELEFESAAMRDAVLDALRRDALPAEVIADEHHLFDRSRSRAMAVSDHATDLAPVEPTRHG